MTDTLTPWDRQPRESEEAYAAFVIYRDLGVARSTAAVGRQCGKTKRLMERWSSQHAWVARVHAWDVEQQRTADQARVAHRDQAVRQHEQAAQVLLNTALRQLQPPANPPADWRPRASALMAATQALDKAIHHQRLALGLPTDVTQQQVVVKQAVADLAANFDTLTRVMQEHLCDECRDRLAPELRRLHERAQRAVALIG